MAKVAVSVVRRSGSVGRVEAQRVRKVRPDDRLRRNPPSPDTIVVHPI